MQILYYLIASVVLAELIIIIVQTVRLSLAKRSLKVVERDMNKLVEARARELATSIIDKAREDAARRSSAVTAGKIYEQLAPILPGFRFNPKDVRFLGSPVDFVVFDGLEDGKSVYVRFIELKSGDSKLTDREKAVKDAVESCRVSFEIVRAEDLLKR